MGGGLIQLVAYGSQDTVLTGNPQATFWKFVYKKYTNFAMECHNIELEGAGALRSAIIPRQGDLLSKTYLYFDNQSSRGIPIHAVLEYVEIEIGGQVIQKQTGEWMSVWNKLSIPEGKKNGYNEMIGSGLLNNRM